MRFLRKKAHTARSPFSNRARPRVEELEPRLVPYALSGNAWPQRELVTIGFVPDGTNLGGVSSNLIATLNARFGSQSYWQNRIIWAAQVWAQHTNLNFTVITDNGAPIGSGPYQQGNPLMADIRIGGYNLGSRLAQTYPAPPGNNFSLAGDVQFNTTTPWVIDTTGGYDLFTVAMHEIGHALGLGHSYYGTSMFHYYAYSRINLHADDIAGIRALYSGGAGRSPDANDAVAPNETFGSAPSLDPLINWSTYTVELQERDITTTSDVDFYVIHVPGGTTGTMRVRLQSSGRSLLAPTLTVYNANQQQVGQAISAGPLGHTLDVTIAGVQPGQAYYIKAAPNATSAFGTGKYGLMLSFRDNPLPALYVPNTQTPNGSPLQSRGFEYLGSEDDHGHGHDGCCCPFCGGRAPDAAGEEKALPRVDDISASLVAALGDAAEPTPGPSGGEDEPVVVAFPRDDAYLPAASELRKWTKPAGSELETGAESFLVAHDAYFAEELGLAPEMDCAVEMLAYLD